VTADTKNLKRDFDALYTRVQPSLWRYVQRLTGDADAADDVVQEAFVRLLERTEPRGDGARVWLFTVATNLVRDRGRTSTRRRRLLESVPMERNPPPLADQEMIRAEAVQRVRAVLDQLGERDRQLLLMREEGFKYGEIAQVVGVAPGSVGTLIARAIRRFTDIYTPEGG